MDNIFENILELQKQLTELEHQHWVKTVVFSFNWWILLVLLIVPWFFWWRLSDKKRLKEILLFGTYIMVVSSTLDDFGLALSYWAYPYQLLQVGDRLNSVDLTTLPILYMLIYQHFPRWKHFIIANLIFSFSCAFVFEPLLIWMGIYVKLSWKYVYSFPIYFVIAIIGKLILSKINRISESI